jgi:hypothetical protein
VFALCPALALCSAVALLLLGGCLEQEASDGGALSADRVPRLTLVEELRIGSVRDGREGFSRIRQIFVDREGRAFVFDDMDFQMRVFDREGQELYRFGGRGDGPGEFQILPGFELEGDTLWAVETLVRRLTVFERSGRVLGTGRIEAVPVWVAPGFMGLVMPRWLLEDGTFLGDVRFTMQATPSRPAPGDAPPGTDDPIRIPQIRFDLRGQVIDTIGWSIQPPPQVPAMARPEPETFEFRSVPYRVPVGPIDAPIRISPGLFDDSILVERPTPATGEIATFRVTHVRAAGDTVYDRELSYTPVAYSTEQLDRMAWDEVVRGHSMLGTLGAPGTPEADSVDHFREVRRRMDLPPYQPPIQPLSVGPNAIQRPDRAAYRMGSEGTLWLRREDDREAVLRWLLLDETGLPLGELAVPRHAWVSWSGGDEVWTIEHDEFDVPWVVRYRIEAEG